MVDAYLVISAIILSVVLLVVCVILLIQFGHPDDKSVAVFPKLCVIFGLFATAATVLVIPYDVANARGSGGGLRIDILWQILFMVDAILIAFVLPYAFFFYESDTDPVLERKDPEKLGLCDKQGFVALKYTMATFLVFTLITFLMYLFLGKAEIPVERITQGASLWTTTPTPRTDICPTGSCTTDSFVWKLSVTFPIYVVALLSFIGWFFFSVFTGIGLVALPLDLINEWRTRPVRIERKDYYTQKMELGKRAQALLKVSREFHAELKDASRQPDRKSKKNDQKAQKGLETATYLLKNTNKALDVSYRLNGGNPLIPFSKLVMGIIGLAISLTWIVHICLFMLPEDPPYNVLNTVFIDLETFISGFSLLGVVGFGVFTFYLLWCCIKGNFRVGLRIPFIIKIFPMELHGTMVNSFLFNTWLLLICSLPLVQFSASAVPLYARYTDINIIFGLQVRYLIFLKYFFANNVFIYVMLGISFLTCCVLVISPRNTAAQIEEQVLRVANGED